MRYIIAVLTVALATVAVFAVALESTSVQARSSYNGFVKACNGKKVYLRPAEKRTLRLHNRARVIRDIPRLCIQQQLQRAARKHSIDMLRKDYFSHTSSDGSSLAQRVRREGYSPRGMSVYQVGENVGWGAGSLGRPVNVHRSWMRSAGHNKNLLKRSFRQVGIGVARGQFRSYEDSRIYTVDLGTRR